MVVDTNSLKDELINKVIGGCKLARRLGKGAMGVVYLAEQTNLRRKVALKILDSKFSSDAAYVARFEQEAKSAAKLSHPNIVQIYDFGHEGNMYYMVNEFVDGISVQNLINQKGCVPPEQAIDFAMQATRGLAAAHEARIVHRDIKPDNLMLSKDGLIKIADFGLAKIMESNAAVTQSGLIMGTPFYMSPEQAKGLIIDSRSDIYSLGISLYYMLIGEVPFDADSVVGVLLKQISADRPDPCAINPLLPPVLGALVMRMMEKLPDNRPANPEELLQELESVNRILRPEAPPPALAEVAEVSEEQRNQFKPLPANRINRITRVDASGDVLTRMITSLPGDGGVMIATDNPLPVNSAIEVRFNVPGKDEEFSGLGLVRWSDEKNIGVTFIKVQQVSRGNKADEGAMRLSGPMAINALTATPIHQRLLRYVYANAGQTVDVAQIVGALGIGAKMIEAPVATFERAAMIKRQPGNKLELKWPQDEALQREIVVWIGRHGLK